MKFYPLVAAFFLPFICFSQIEFQKKKLEIFDESSENVITYKNSKDKSGNTIQVDQYYFVHFEDSSLVHRLKYKKNKYWYAYTYLSIEKKTRNTLLGTSTRSIGVNHGDYFSLNDDGSVNGFWKYEYGEQIGLAYEYFYYPNGNLKFIYTYDNDINVWNVLTYRYPDGKEYDYGDFKDGKGTIFHLDDEGIPCVKCITKGKRTVREVNCD